MAEVDVVVKPGEPRKTAPPPVDRKRSGTGSRTGSNKSKPKAKAKLTTAKDPYKAAEKRAVARENKQRLKSGMRFNKAALDLKPQITALKDALKNEFKRSRDQNLGDIDMMLQQQFGMLKEDAAKRGSQFLTAARDNEMATGDTMEGGFRNMVRERQDSLTGILEQGAGETDTMRAMVMAARNWQGNASEANRAYFDTASSINQGINDLNIDTKTALANAHTTAEGQREQTWQDFYNRRSEAMTNLGNLYGQRLDYMAQAKEMGVKFGKVRKGRVSDSEKGMKKAFKDSANELGKSYEQQKLPGWVEDYEGTQQVERRQSNSNLAAAMTVEPLGKAEGASSLRKWD